MLHTHQRPNFSSVFLYDEPFLNYGLFHESAPNDLDLFKVANTNMHATYTLEAQIFNHFALR